MFRENAPRRNKAAPIPCNYDTQAFRIIRRLFSDEYALLLKEVRLFANFKIAKIA